MEYDLILFDQSIVFSSSYEKKAFTSILQLTNLSMHAQNDVMII